MKKMFNNNIIVIHWIKISRVITFPSLLLEVITFFENESSTLQIARWFGFRSLENLMNLNIFMTKFIKSNFEEAENYKK